MASHNSAKHHLKARQHQQQYDAYASAHGFYASQSELAHHYNHSQQYHLIDPSLENGMVYNGQVASSNIVAECLNSSVTPS